MAILMAVQTNSCVSEVSDANVDADTVVMPLLSSRLNFASLSDTIRLRKKQTAKLGWREMRAGRRWRWQSAC